MRNITKVSRKNESEITKKKVPLLLSSGRLSDEVMPQQHPPGLPFLRHTDPIKVYHVDENYGLGGWLEQKKDGEDARLFVVKKDREDQKNYYKEMINRERTISLAGNRNNLYVP